MWGYGIAGLIPRSTDLSRSQAQKSSEVKKTEAARVYCLLFSDVYVYILVALLNNTLFQLPHE